MQEFEHVTVLLNEAVDGLHIKEDGIYVDATLGGAGHSQKILQQLTTGHLYCFDQDLHAITTAKEKLNAISDNYTIIDSNFVYMKEELENLGITKVDGILFDLGVSSPQFDVGDRGFSYNHDHRLDMRMNVRQELNAYSIVNTWPYAKIVEILYKYADEKFAKQIARKIEQTRSIAPIETTFQLVEVIKDAIPAPARRKGGHPAKRTFQALRIAVNDELNVFEKALQQSLDLLNVGGRISVITFHSLEDKICKYMFNDVTRVKDVPPGLPVVPEYLLPKFELVNRKVIVASDEELEQNHRAHSAKLRIIERVKEDET
ncbi:MAG: 16S rRNA (cytosine(1402)-N(4))-methyltransferase RsmH [Coprobacillaceae bacterium]